MRHVEARVVEGIAGAFVRYDGVHRRLAVASLAAFVLLAVSIGRAHADDLPHHPPVFDFTLALGETGVAVGTRTFSAVGNVGGNVGVVSYRGRDLGFDRPRLFVGGAAIHAAPIASLRALAFYGRFFVGVYGRPDATPSTVDALQVSNGGLGMLSYSFGAELQGLAGRWFFRGGLGLGEKSLLTGSRSTPRFTTTAPIYESHFAAYYVLSGNDRDGGGMIGVDVGLDLGPIKAWTVTVPLTVALFWKTFLSSGTRATATIYETRVAAH